MTSHLKADVRTLTDALRAAHVQVRAKIGAARHADALAALSPTNRAVAPSVDDGRASATSPDRTAAVTLPAVRAAAAGGGTSSAAAETRDDEGVAAIMQLVRVAGLPGYKKADP